MIRSTNLILTDDEKRAEKKRADVRRRRDAIAEYALLLVMACLAASVNYLNLRSDNQDEARSFAAKNVVRGGPKPPYLISTPMRKETILVGETKIARQWYFNDDASMRHVDTVPDEAAAQIGYVRDDVVYSHDRRRKVWEKTDVLKGDNGHPASYVSFQFTYTSDTDWTVTVVSATPGGWSWTHHVDTFENNQLASQTIYDRSGSSTRRVFAVNKTRPVVVDEDDEAAKPAEAKPAEAKPAEAAKPAGPAAGANPQDASGATPPRSNPPTTATARDSRGASASANAQPSPR